MNTLRSIGWLMCLTSFCAYGECWDKFDQSAKRNSDFVAALQCLESIKKGDLSLPVGTILASMLPPVEFANEMGDPSVFDPKKSRWSLADGRDVSLSRYRSIAASFHVPDLRGMFLRGLNAGRKDGKEDPENERQPGSYQDDEIKSHDHQLGFKLHGLANGKGNGDLEGGVPGVKTQLTGGKESRPRNVAVFYYIKIN